MTPKIPISDSVVYLVDTSSLIFRAFYAIPNLTSPQGVPVNALYGFINMTLKLLSEKQPNHLIFCQDSKVKGERYQIYPQYKANRGEMPEPLIPQMALISEFIDLMGLPRVQIEGVEADDIIGTLAHQLEKAGNQVVIVSSDKDFVQLITPQIRMYDTMKDIYYDRDLAFSKWAVTPEQMIDYLALVGDSSDNIPGVTGVGPKTACQLLAEFSSLDGIYQNLHTIKGATQKRLAENQAMAYLSKQLVTINLNIDLSLFLEKLLASDRDPAVITSFLEHYNFKSLISAFGKLSESPASHQKPKRVSTLKSLDYSVPAVSAFISNSEGPLWIDHCDSFISLSDGSLLIQIPKEESTQFASAIGLKSLSGSNLKNLAHALKLPHLKVTWDNSVAAYIASSGQSVDLESMSLKYLNTSVTQFTFPIEAQIALAPVLRHELNDQIKIVEEIEFPLIEILYEMELKGVLLDTDWLIQEGLTLFNELKLIESRIFNLTHKEFNISSPKQLSTILFEDLKLPAKKKTKTGFSTDNEVLESLKDSHPVIAEILDFRELSKLKSTYIDPLPQMVDHQGRIHTTFQQMVTTTGRLSSTNPNLQNIPIRTERGERLRAAFMAPKGSLLGAFDYSQIELRVLAHFSQDPGLIKAFEQSQDIHSATASEIFETPLADISSDQRRIAKAVNFGIAYGQTAFGLSQTLGISRKEAQDIIDRYFGRFSKVRDYIQDTIETAKNQGYVETLLGRRRYIPDILSNNGNLQKFAERAAINAPMQGSSADLVKLAMIKVQQNCQSQLILQVHDELIFEAPTEILQAEAPQIKQLMESIIPLKVPLVVHYGLGLNWSEAH